MSDRMERLLEDWNETADSAGPPEDIVNSYKQGFVVAKKGCANELAALNPKLDALIAAGKQLRRLWGDGAATSDVWDAALRDWEGQPQEKGKEPK